MAAYPFAAWLLLLAAKAHRVTLSDEHLATETETELELAGEMGLEGKDINVVMGEGASWSKGDTGKTSVCGIEFSLVTANDLREEHKSKGAEGMEGWYVVGANEGSAKGCEFSAGEERVLKSVKVTVGMRLEGEPDQKKFTLSYIPAVFHMDERAGTPRSLELGYFFPKDVLACEAEKVGVYCFGGLTSYHCAAWVHWAQDGDSCAFKTMIDLTSLSAAEKDAGYGGTKGEGFDEQLGKIKVEYAAYAKAGLKLTGFRVKHYKMDKSEEKKGGSWNMAMTAVEKGQTLKRVLYSVYSFAKYRGWFSQLGNNCQMFAAWVASEISGQTVKPAYSILFSPVQGVPIAMPTPENAGSVAMQNKAEKEADVLEE